jgi:hypothetical protein
MPDKEKMRRLDLVGYRVLPTCGLCEHASIPQGRVWGSCARHAYQHETHTGPARPLSVHASGSCSAFRLAEPRRIDLEASGFDRLLDFREAPAEPCKACEVRRRQGFDGSCPRCAQARARR